MGLTRLVRPVGSLRAYRSHGDTMQLRNSYNYTAADSHSLLRAETNYFHRDYCDWLFRQQNPVQLFL